MKTGKKLLALLLAVVMTMSLLTVGAFAAVSYTHLVQSGATAIRSRAASQMQM